MPDVQGRSVTGGEVRIVDAEVGGLDRKLDGDVIRPSDTSYDEARSVFNEMIDKRPALIAQCAGTRDVVTCVRFAREHGLLVSVRGGGHNVAGKAVCDGGLVIDLSSMRTVDVDPEARIAQAQGGATLADVDAATQEHGLATTLGVISMTGIGGLTLGGGIGWLMGKHGLACDNVISVELVTADGRVLNASDEENPELFWALRGGGGNFGVATSFTYRLHPVGPEVVGGLAVHPVEDARELLRFFREFCGEVPDEIRLQAGLLTSPEGAPVAALAGCYVGPVEEGMEAVRPLREFGEPLDLDLGPRPYLEVQSMSDELFPPGLRHYWKSSFLGGLPDAAIGTLVESFADAPLPGCILLLEQMGGAVRRVSLEETAFPHREAEYNLLVLDMWEDESEDAENIAWARSTWDAMQPHSTGGAYVNYLGDEGEARVREAYGSNYDRLARVKAKYDPDNFFRLNQNVPPTM